MNSLLMKLRENNVFISVEKNELKVRFNGSSIREDLLEEIKTNKDRLVSYLVNYNKQSVAIKSAAVSGRGGFPLSSSQFRLWVLSQVEEGNIAYNMPGMYFFEGDLNNDALDFAFAALISRHESLRTIFKENDQGEARQFIQSPDASGFAIRHCDLRQEADKETVLKLRVRQECVKPFNLAEGPLMRAILFRIEDKKWLFTCVMHHIISDGWSMHIVKRELLQQYHAFISGETDPLPPLRIQYKDYAVWQQEIFSRGALNEHKTWWLKQFEGELPVLQLRGHFTRPMLKTYNGEAICVVIDPETTKGFKQLIQKRNATLFMGLLGVVAVLLNAYSDQEDIIIGTPIIGREHMDLENQIGFFLNTLPLRIRFTGEESYDGLLEKIRRTTLDAFEHQIYPFDRLVDELHLHRDISRNPLFDVLVILQNTKIGHDAHRQNNESLRVSGYGDRPILTSKLDLTFDFNETAGGIQLSLVYNSDIYDKPFAEQLGVHFNRLTRAVTERSFISIQGLEYMDADEMKHHITTYNETVTAFAVPVSDEF